MGVSRQLWEVLQSLSAGVKRNLSHGVLSSWLLSSLQPTWRSPSEMNWSTFCEMLLACSHWRGISVFVLKASGNPLNFYCLKPDSFHGQCWSSAWPEEEHEPQDFPVCGCQTSPLGAQASISVFMHSWEPQALGQTLTNGEGTEFPKGLLWAAQARSQKAPGRANACFLSLLHRCITSPVLPSSSRWKNFPSTLCQVFWKMLHLSAKQT